MRARAGAVERSCLGNTMKVATTRKHTLALALWLAVPLAALVSCGGGGDDEPSQNQQTVCLNCSGLSGNARLNCETQNANRSGC